MIFMYVPAVYAILTSKEEVKRLKGEIQRKREINDIKQRKYS